VTATFLSGGLWDSLTGTNPAPPGWVVLATGAVALFVVADTSTWRRARHLVTLAHEGGHAAIAVLSGRRLHGVRLHSDTSGLTVSAGRPEGPGMVATAAAGYPAPTAIGLAVTIGVVSGHLAATLWGCLLLVVAVGITVRNLFGLLSVLLTGVVLAAVPIWAPVAVQAAFGYLLAWFLLLSGPRPVLELQVKRHRERVSLTDADQLARLTGIPGVAWVAVFLLLTLGGAVAGGWALLGAPHSGSALFGLLG
jgi:hypothetical protein